VHGEGEVVDRPAKFLYKAAKDATPAKDLFLGSLGVSAAGKENAQHDL
jgi:hypothetical protein